MQNERQPRSTAHVSLDSICVDTKKEHLATTWELTCSAAYSSVICRPLVTSSVTTSAIGQPCSNPNNNHRFMVSLLTAETCTKLEPEDGELICQGGHDKYWLWWNKIVLKKITFGVATSVAVILDGAISHRKLNCLITIYLNLTVFYSQSSKHFCDSIFPMYSGGKHWCDYQRFREGSVSLWLPFVPIHLQLFREYIWDVGKTPFHVCQVGKKFACFCSLAISRPGETEKMSVFVYSLNWFTHGCHW